MKKKFRVFVTSRIPEAGLQILASKCELDIFADEKLTRTQFIRHLQDKDGLLCLLSNPVDSEIIDSAPRLKVISNYAVGYNNIDIQAATRRGIVVTNTPGVLTDATADLAWALLLAVSRRIVEGDRMMRRGDYRGWEPQLLLGQDLKDKTLGILGAGRIGSAVARRSVGWNMQVLYFDRKRNPDLEEKVNARFTPLNQLFAYSDFISIHLPLTAETNHLVDEKALRRMKSTACLVNTARGPIVDEAALVRALKEGWIAGAALDVFENEPEIHPELKSLNNAVLTPHIGSATVGTRNAMAKIAAENLLAVLAGGKPRFPVNHIG
ncbi:D-glycerate dehydrogenase [candidate division KSB1 bacterium 4484_188]|nr:MAG: D-glycerate dehydrogenase [candidate division KSB1 bacterium 4484_188]